ncbi:restriction endonuclease subunit S [Winogradskyella sp. KYW1333]|uniref:restriction endonuclease subunit S n=1 Tax=Winogradskyella sp. KYW1333 TaxID=2282123 RepID=UPI000DF19191|nr:restriction endonuclease subunit S [Winogradskyella sp. KYW1333]RCT56389.1 restriction endonuclease subunit S [Winogradskyella sp. KYW1333]
MSTATTHIKTDKQLVPELRFKEYEGDWSDNRLRNLLSEKIANGETVEKADFGIEESNFYLVQLNDLFKSSVELDVAELMKVKLKQNAKSLSLNDVIINRVSINPSGVAKTSIVAKLPIGLNTSFESNMFRVRFQTESIDPLFFCCFSLSSFYIKQKLALAKVTNQASLSQGDIGFIKIPFPSLPEQQKIASFLSAVDEKIQLLTKKKALLEQYKKGVMQQLFSYEKRLYEGELRKGNLGDFGFFYYGKGAPKTSIVEGAPTPCVRYGELYSTFKEEIKEIKSYTIVDPKDLKLSKGGEVLVPRVGEDPLDFANCSYLPFPNVAIGEMISVYNTDEDGLFMTYYINARLQKQLARMVEGGNVSNLYFRYVEKIEVEIPCVEEQQKIIGFLSSIDTKIEAVNNQITQTQTFKKGLLQQMFVAA